MSEGLKRPETNLQISEKGDDLAAEGQVVEADLQEPTERQVGGAAVRHERRGFDARLRRDQGRRVEARDELPEIGGRGFELPNNFAKNFWPIVLKLPERNAQLDGRMVGRKHEPRVLGHGHGHGCVHAVGPNKCLT